MEKKASVLLLLLVLLVIDELMVHTEARTCYSKSKKFRGKCFTKNQMSNCKSICKRENFTAGRCSRGKCLCSKKCKLLGAPPPPPPPPIEGGDGGGDEGGDGGQEGGGGGKGGSGSGGKGGVGGGGGEMYLTTKLE